MSLVAAIMLLIISLPTAAAYFFYRWLRKKGIKYVGLIPLIIASVWTAYEAYTAIYPTDSFYFSEFKEVTLREAPKSATILQKEASYPGIHGDYCSASLIRVSSADYNILLNQLVVDKKIIKNKKGEIGGSSELYKVMGTLKPEQIIHSFSRSIPGEEDHYLSIGFLDDNKTIVISVCVT
ncbi:hypothetical protein C8E01_1316 [Pontibacter virosus]|uniref:Uncharacterized protein n=1 Tax=Pontibacter virosus TaxID=1765052 RepID=A0A2U1AH10_9BACT|nr:hypothetical protein C8E01_1316 [Pontibacter virosus]